MRSVFIAVVLGFVFTAIGCGPGVVSVYPVKGKLTKGGAALGDVHLILTPTADGDHPFASSDVAADGTFELKCSDGRTGAPAGSYKVILSAKAKPAADATAEMLAMRDKMESGESADPSKIAAGAGSVIPPEYANKDKSPKTVEIKAEAQTLEIDI